MQHWNKKANCRALIAEEDVSQQIVFAEALRTEGFSVFVTSNGNEALGAICAAGDVDLLIANVQLRGRMNGFELAAQAQRLSPKIRTLFMTGLPKEIAYTKNKADINAEILFKPFKLVDFTNKVIAMAKDLPCRQVRAA